MHKLDLTIATRPSVLLVKEESNDWKISRCTCCSKFRYVMAVVNSIRRNSRNNSLAIEEAMKSAVGVVTAAYLQSALVGSTIGKLDGTVIARMHFVSNAVTEIVLKMN